MAEYGRVQSNRLSRAIAKSETGSRQLKGFVDNRSNNLVAQLWTNNIRDMYSRSGFQETKLYNTYIYGLKEGDDTIKYVGKTWQAPEARLDQHRRRLNKPHLTEELLANGQWTRFAAATHEQKWIVDKGGINGLWNRIDALSKDKWQWFYNPEDPVNANQAKLEDIFMPAGEVDRDGASEEESNNENLEKAAL